MAIPVAKNLAAPLVLVNLVLYTLIVGFASWGLDKFIDGQQNHPKLAGNSATSHFLLFSILAGVLGVISKLAGLFHVLQWKPQGLAATASLATVTWAVTALAFGLACKQIDVGGDRGWRLRGLEGLTLTLTFTQLLHMLQMHAAVNEH